MPSVAVFTKGMVDIVITAEAARRLAAEIIDALVALKKEKPVRRDTDTNTAFEQLADR